MFWFVLESFSCEVVKSLITVDSIEYLWNIESFFQKHLRSEAQRTFSTWLTPCVDEAATSTPTCEKKVNSDWIEWYNTRLNVRLVPINRCCFFHFHSAVSFQLSTISHRSAERLATSSSIIQSVIQLKVIIRMSLLALVLQIACLVGAIITEDKIVPQLKEKRKWICRLDLSLNIDRFAYSRLLCNLHSM